MNGRWRNNKSIQFHIQGQCIGLMQQLHEGFSKLRICGSKVGFLQSISNNEKWCTSIFTIENPESKNNRRGGSVLWIIIEVGK
jgi:hypothetical protein